MSSAPGPGSNGATPGPSVPGSAAEARALVIDASRALAAAGQSDMVWGHVAVRDPEGRGIWIKAPGWGLDEVGEGLLQLVSFDAHVLEGEGRPHLECHIHLSCLRAGPARVCSVHTHAEPAVAFAAVETPLLAISHDGALFAGADVPRFRETGGLVRTPELGDALAASLGDAPAALMPRHGLVAVGTSVAAAVMHTVLLTRACRTQLLAMSAGAVQNSSSLAEARAKAGECWPDSQLEAGWRYLVRQATRAYSPDPTPRST